MTQQPITTEFNDPKMARDRFVQDMWDRRILVVFPVDDLFPSQGYTFSELTSFLETNNDLSTLEKLDGVDVFGTSEEKDFIGFKHKVEDAKNRGAITILIASDPMDAIFLSPRDHVILYGEKGTAKDITKTRNVTSVKTFKDACEVLAWIRYDLETSRVKEHKPILRNLDWSQYPDAPHALVH